MRPGKSSNLPYGGPRVGGGFFRARYPFTQLDKQVVSESTCAYIRGTPKYLVCIPDGIRMPTPNPHTARPRSQRSFWVGQTVRSRTTRTLNPRPRLPLAALLADAPRQERGDQRPLLRAVLHGVRVWGVRLTVVILDGIEVRVSNILVWVGKTFF